MLTIKLETDFNRNYVGLSVNPMNQSEVLA